MMKRIFLLITTLYALNACTNAPSFRDHPDSHKIYDYLNHEGQSDTVKLLKQGLMMNQTMGYQDPYSAIRNPDIIVPVWVVGRVHPGTGEKIQGHWKHLVVKESTWAE